MIGTPARPSSNDLPPWLAFGMFAVCWLALLGGMPGTLSPIDLPWARYLRGPDMGGGVGGLLYSIRAQGLKYNLSNGRGDIVAQSDASGTLTWTASYEAYGKRTLELGSNEDRQRANTKEEDPTGLLNEGFRYRDLETGVWLSRDPAGFVDGPNLYAYVKQNPWTHWDPLGLKVPENRNEAESVARCMERQSKQLQKDQAARDRFARIASDERMRGSWIHKRAEQEVARLDVRIEATAKDLDYHARSLAIYCDAAESGDADDIGHANFCENRYGKGVYAEPGLRETTSDLAEIAGAVGMAKGVMSLASTVMKRFAAKTPLVVNEATIAKALEGSTMQTIQGRVSQPMVERYVRMLEAGKTPPPIQVSDGVIVNGNHRYVAGRIFGVEPPTVPYVRPSTSVPKPIQQTTVDPLDWGGH